MLPVRNPPGDPILTFKLPPLESGDDIIMLLLFFFRLPQRDWMESKPGVHLNPAATLSIGGLSMGEQLQSSQRQLPTELQGNFPW
jgi:hypothetical protein